MHPNIHSKSGPCTPNTKLNLGDRVLGEAEKNRFFALPGKEGHSGLTSSKLCPDPKRVVRSFTVMFQKAMISLWTFFWLAGGEIGGSQHQPSGSDWSGAYVLVSSMQLTFPTWCRFSYLTNSSKILLCISLEREPGPCPRAAPFFWFLLPCLCIHSLPWLAAIWTCLLELREGQGTWIKPISCNKEIGGKGTQKGFCAQKPQRVLLGFNNSTIYNNHDLEGTQVPTNRRMDEEGVTDMCVYTHTHRHTHSGLLLIHKKNEILPFATIQKDPGNIMLNEISQIKTNVWYHLYVEIKK